MNTLQALVLNQGFNKLAFSVGEAAGKGALAGGIGMAGMQGAGLLAGSYRINPANVVHGTGQGALAGLAGRSIWGSGTKEKGDWLSPEEKSLILAGAVNPALSQTLAGIRALAKGQTHHLPSILGAGLGGALTGGLAGYGLAQI